MFILNKLKSKDGFIKSLKQCLTFLNVIWVRWYWCPATKQYIGRAIIYLKLWVINRFLKQAITVILIRKNKTLGYTLVNKYIKINRVNVKKSDNNPMKLYLNKNFYISTKAHILTKFKQVRYS